MATISSILSEGRSNKIPHGMIPKSQLQKAISNVILKDGRGTLALPWSTAIEIDKFYELRSWTAVIKQEKIIRTITSIPLSSRDILDIHRAGSSLLTAIDRDNKVTTPTLSILFYTIYRNLYYSISISLIPRPSNFLLLTLKLIVTR